MQTLMFIILLGIFSLGILRGTVFIEVMRAGFLSSEIPRLQYMFQTYLEKFEYLPGDDPRAPTRYSRPLPMHEVVGVRANLTGNRTINGALMDYLNPTGENFAAWQDLRAADMLDGDASLVGSSAMPDHMFEGKYGISQQNMGLGQSICATNIPGRAARRVDEEIDDGDISSGNLRGTARFDIDAFNVFDEPDTEPYDVGKTYIVCFPLLPSF